MKLLKRSVQQLIQAGKKRKTVVIVSAISLLIFLAGVGGYVIAILPNFSHSICTNCHIGGAPAPDHSACTNCHSGTIPYDPNLVEQPKNIMADFAKSYHHPISGTDPNSTCRSCHNNMGDLDPEGNYYPKLLSTQDAGGNCVYQGNAFCYVCHGSGSTYNMTVFDSSAHNDARLDPTSGTKVKCSSCHLPHGSDFTSLTIAANENLCYQCHNNPANSEHGINIQARFTVSGNNAAHHSLGANLQCRNCHEAHANTRANKMADPDSSTRPRDLYTNTAIDPRSFTATRSEQNNVAVVYTGSWSTYYAAGDSGGSSTRSTRSGSTGTFSFIGSGINLIMRNGSGAGTFYLLYLDNVQQTFAPISYGGYQRVVFSRSNLTYGVHTIKLVSTGLTGSYMPYLDAFDVLNSYPLLADYRSFCDKCHDNAPPAGVTVSGLTNIAATYTDDFHGDAPGPELVLYSSTGTLAPPYTRQMVALACSDCHDEHGSANVYHLKETVNSKTGISVTSSDGSDALAFCTACHVGTTNNFHDCASSGCHDSNPTNNCFGCHFHGAPKDYMPWGDKTGGDF